MNTDSHTLTARPHTPHREEEKLSIASHGTYNTDEWYTRTEAPAGPEVGTHPRHRSFDRVPGDDQTVP